MTLRDPDFDGIENLQEFLAIIIIEIFSRIRFVMAVNTTHLLLILIMIAAGAGFLFQSYLAGRKNSQQPSDDS